MTDRKEESTEEKGTRDSGMEDKRERHRRKRKKRQLFTNLLVFSILLFTAVGIVVSQSRGNQMKRLARLEQVSAKQREDAAEQGGQAEDDGMVDIEGFFDRLGKVEFPDWIEVDLIEVDGASRRGEELEAVRDIVIHYVGNPGTTARQNRDYFSNEDSDVSAHFVVGLEGEIIQCIPLTEKSSATNERNKDTISIEVCHPDETGAFQEASYASLVKLTTWLCEVTGLSDSHVIRHYDVTGKLCPLYYVEHEDAWEQFLQDVK